MWIWLVNLKASRNPEAPRPPILGEEKINFEVFGQNQPPSVLNAETYLYTFKVPVVKD